MGRFLEEGEPLKQRTRCACSTPPVTSRSCGRPWT